MIWRTTASILPITCWKLTTRRRKWHSAPAFLHVLYFYSQHSTSPSRHTVERFTLTDLPSRLPVFEPESELLGLYCQTLTQLLISNAMPRDMAKVMEGLLYELVSFYADTLNAPRWLQTPEGRVAIDALID